MPSDRDRMEALEVEIRILRMLIAHLAVKTMGQKWADAQLAALAAMHKPLKGDA